MDKQTLRFLWNIPRWSGIPYAIALAWYSVAWLAGGHGTPFPPSVILAPCPFGLLLWPTVFAIGMCTSTRVRRIAVCTTLFQYAAGGLIFAFGWPEQAQHFRGRGGTSFPPYLIESAGGFLTGQVVLWLGILLSPRPTPPSSPKIVDETCGAS